jgi:hypothetical protein
MRDELFADENEDLGEFHNEELETESSDTSGFREYSCQFCGETNEVFVDASGLAHQKFTEDCTVCCRPNLLTIDIAHDGTVFVEAEREYDA